MNKFIKSFEKLENRIKTKLSHYPILYALIGGVGIVLFWRGVWHLADDANMTSIASLVLGSFILIMTGVFVSGLIGTRLIISGLIGEKKIAEKEEEEIETEEMQIQNLQDTLNRLEKKLEHIDKEVENNK